MARCPFCNCDPDEMKQAKILLDGIIAPPILHHRKSSRAQLVGCSTSAGVCDRGV